ncbi:MAG: AAA family ATPase [Chloroflexota bacterium]|nr:AAA family ATPase [Chloroflexota bacterium]
MSAVGQRIVVVGSSGSGKTTLARRLAQQRGIPHVELDALHWEPNWTEAPVEVFRDRVTVALAGPTWVMDGNYSRVRDISWGRADTVIWLDYSLPRILWQLIRRTLHRAVTREELWSGNRESLRRSLISRDSILFWMLTHYGTIRRRYRQALTDPQYAHIHIIRLRSPRATERWIARTFGQ